MRLIKRQTTNLRSIAGKGIQYDIDDQVIVDSQRAMVVPVGPLEERPGEVGVATSSTAGQVRYNTTDQQLEAYQNGAWREVRFKEPNRDPGIRWQPLSGADGSEQVFGELDSGDSDFLVPNAAENILVLIENVLQIPTTNYSIQQTAWVNDVANNQPNAGSYVASSTGWWLVFTSPVPFGKPITVVHNLDK